MGHHGLLFRLPAKLADDLRQLLRQLPRQDAGNQIGEAPARIEAAQQAEETNESIVRHRARLIASEAPVRGRDPECDDVSLGALRRWTLGAGLSGLGPRVAGSIGSNGSNRAPRA